MEAKFLSELLLRDVGGGRFDLLGPLRFYSKELDRIVEAPAGYNTDLGSIPPWVPGWMIPKLGDYDYPAVIHDAAYDHVLGGLLGATKDQADRLFLEGMAARNVNLVQRRWLYLAVHWFGRTKASARPVTPAVEKD
jgi:hypothetical protein